jgi:hypothetical protein
MKTTAKDWRFNAKGLIDAAIGKTTRRFKTLTPIPVDCGRGDYNI